MKNIHNKKSSNKFKPSKKKLIEHTSTTIEPTNKKSEDSFSSLLSPSPNSTKDQHLLLSDIKKFNFNNNTKIKQNNGLDIIQTIQIHPKDNMTLDVNLIEELYEEENISDHGTHRSRCKPRKSTMMGELSLVENTPLGIGNNNESVS